MAPQDDLTAERAAKQYTMNDLFKLAMEGKVNIVEDRFVSAAALKTARQEALREARQLVSTMFDQQASELPDYYAALLDVGNALDRLASEGG